MARTRLTWHRNAGERKSLWCPRRTPGLEKSLLVADSMFKAILHSKSRHTILEVTRQTRTNLLNKTRLTIFFITLGPIH